MTDVRAIGAVPAKGRQTTVTRGKGKARKTLAEVVYVTTSTPANGPAVVITSTSIVSTVISNAAPTQASSAGGAATDTSSGLNQTLTATARSTSSTGSTTSTTQSGVATSSTVASASTSTATPASASSSNPSASPSSNTGGGLKAGDVAGVAVGCLAGGALIAFLIAFLLFRRRKSREAEAGGFYPHDNRSQRDAVVPAATEKSIATSNSSAVGSWQVYLPQAADDRTIQNAVKTFFNQIDLHVDNFYQRNGVPMDSRTREALAQIDSGKLPGRIEDLMQDQRMVLPVIKHTIADLLITRLSPLTFPETSLLPPYMAEFPPKLQTSSKSAGESQAMQQAYSQWRLLNAYLYPHPEKDATYLEDRESKAHEIADLLSAAFSPWQQSSAYEKGDLHQHERGLVATAGNLGILLMSQPSAFEFRWSTTTGPGRTATNQGFVMFPGFWKTSDDQGRVLDVPQNLASPSVPRI